MSKQDLVDAYNKLNEKHTFTPGDIVEWKPGMKNKMSAGPYVVVETLDTPVFAVENGSGSPYFRESLDMVGGIYDTDGDFVCYHLDSRRFQPVAD